jgi:hypothetical protein
MQIEALIRASRRGRLPPLQRRVLDYLDHHQAEVFEYRDEQLIRAVKGKASSVGFSLWALHKQGLIDKEKAGGKVYFGSHEAVAKLRQGLGTTDDEAFAAAIANAERIRARVGNVGTLDFLDEMRNERS